MKSITIDIADNVYNCVREFLDTLPSESIKVYDEDLDFLTADEIDELYNIQEKTKNGDFSDFEDWDSMKKNPGIFKISIHKNVFKFIKSRKPSEQKLISQKIELLI